MANSNTASSISNDPLVLKITLDYSEYCKLREAAEFRQSYYKKEQELLNQKPELKNQIGLGSLDASQSSQNEEVVDDTIRSNSNDNSNNHFEQLKSFLVDNLRSEVKLAVKEAFQEQRHLLIPLGAKKKKVKSNQLYSIQSKILILITA